jgi:hypothetical protein
VVEVAEALIEPIAEDVAAPEVEPAALGVSLEGLWSFFGSSRYANMARRRVSKRSEGPLCKCIYSRRNCSRPSRSLVGCSSMIQCPQSSITRPLYKPREALKLFEGPHAHRMISANSPHWHSQFCVHKLDKVRCFSTDRPVDTQCAPPAYKAEPPAGAGGRRRGDGSCPPAR